MLEQSGDLSADEALAAAQREHWGRLLSLLRCAIAVSTNGTETRFLRDRLDAWSDRSR